jgi:hypothetical protein
LAFAGWIAVTSLSLSLALPVSLSFSLVAALKAHGFGVPMVAGLVTAGSQP